MKKTAQKFNLMRPRKVNQGFTLVELLVVIAIIAILAAVVLLVVNPIEITRRGRDSTRLSDLSNLQQAINVAVQEAGTGSGTGSANSLLCAQSGTGSGEGGCSGKSTDSGATANNGNGWVKVNFTGGSNTLSIGSLPVDPSNGTTYYYGYITNGDDTTPTPATAYKLCATLESAAYSPKMSSDGDADNSHYAVGSDMSLVCP